MEEFKIIDGENVKAVTPEVIAELFANLGSDEQARFFNHVAEVASTWGHDISFQLQWITDDEGLSLAGRRVMQQIGEYSHWGLVPHITTELNWDIHSDYNIPEVKE